MPVAVEDIRADGFRRGWIAYLVSQYPAVNHTFILREIQGLRTLGMDVRVASVRAPDRTLDAMGVEEREEAGSTFYLRPKGLLAALAAYVRVLRQGRRDFPRGWG